MPDFNNMEPKKPITDPKGLGADTAFPRHVHKAVPEATETSLIVGWRGKTAVHNENLSVADEDALADALADGWSDQPVLPAAPKVEKAPKAKK